MSKTQDVKIADITPDNRNANKGTSHGAAQLEVSLRKYGAGRSVLLDKDNRIIAGNKTDRNIASFEYTGKTPALIET